MALNYRLPIYIIISNTPEHVSIKDKDKNYFYYLKRKHQIKKDDNINDFCERHEYLKYDIAYQLAVLEERMNEYILEGYRPVGSHVITPSNKTFLDGSILYIVSQAMIHITYK